MRAQQNKQASAKVQNALADIRKAQDCLARAIEHWSNTRLDNSYISGPGDRALVLRLKAQDTLSQALSNLDNVLIDEQQA